MTLRELLAAITLTEHNFKVLHWKACGHSFDRVHVNLSTKLYEMLGADQDVVAEMVLRVGEDVLEYGEALVILNQFNDISFKVISSDKDYNLEDYLMEAGHQLSCILESIELTLYTDPIQEDRKNVGIKAQLEAMYDKYDIEYRYLHARRTTD